MRSVKHLSVLAAVVMVAAVMIPTLAASDVTVGQFVMQFARAKNLNATDARIAVDSLRAVGIRLPADLRMGDRLTEREVVRIAQSAGLPVNTANPDDPFDSEEVDRFFVVFGTELGAGGTNPPVQPTVRTFDPFTKGKGKHKGKAKGHRTPSEPE